MSKTAKTLRSHLEAIDGSERARIYRNALGKRRRKDYSKEDEHKIQAQEIRSDK